MLVKDLMRREVVTVPQDLPVARLYDVLQGANVHGAPVVDEDERLLGFVSQEDVLFGRLGRDDPTGSAEGLTVRDIMTAPAIFIEGNADVADLGRLLWEFRIHHVPVVENSRVAGIVSSMDFCRLIGEGRFVERR